MDSVSAIFAVSMAPWVVALVVSLAGAGLDLERGRIPNWLTLPTLLGGLTWSTASGGLLGLGDALLGCAVAALPYALLFVFANGGAGDAKLMGALGAWLGVVGAGLLLACVALCGGILALFLALAARRFGFAMHNLSLMTRAIVGVMRGQRAQHAQQHMPPLAGMQTMPYGIAICFGVCTAAAIRHLFGV